VKLKALVAAVLLSVAALAQAQDKPAFTFAMHGFVSMSACYQDGAYFPSQCQQALMAAAEPADDASSLTFDVRQSRFNFSVAGPPVLSGATPKGVLEIDFFGGQSAGGFGSVSLFPRLRLAYVETDWGKHKLAFGQMNDLVFGMAPTSISHIGFPLGYGTGNIGWRRPGIWGYHKFGGGGLDIGFDWEIGRSQWNDTAAVGGGVPTNDWAVASGLPAVEARLTVAKAKLFSAFLAGHWNTVDGDGVGVDVADDITVTAVAAGGKVTFKMLTIQAAGFWGDNVGPLIANGLQFIDPGEDDVSSTGFWAQAGFNITPQFSVWALYGMQAPDEDTAKAAGMTRLDNTTMNAILMYRDGGMGLSAEWIGYDTTNYDPGTDTETEAKANTVLLTATYFF
jgi:hypothetical protein